MGEPFVLPDDVTSALVQIKTDGASATPTNEQLRDLDAKAAEQVWNGPFAPPVVVHRHYVFRGQQLQVSWKWELDLGTLRRDPMPAFKDVNSPPEQPLLMSAAISLLYESRKRIFYDTLWFPHQPEDSKAVLAWIEEWAGPELRRRYFDFHAYSSATHHALEGMALIVDRLQEGAELGIKDWLWLGRAWERLGIETKSADSSFTTRAAVHGYYEDLAGKRKGKASSAEKVSVAIERELDAIEPIARKHLSTNPKLRRAPLAVKVWHDLPDDKPKPEPKAIERRLDALKAKARINFPDPLPRGRRAKKVQGGSD